MKKLQVETIDGLKKETVYSIRELSLLRHNLVCKESKKRGIKYLEIPCAFDIETTNIYERNADGTINTDKRPFAFMYHWQFCINDEVCFGRTWDEFQTLLDNLITRMDLDNHRRLVIWAHNLFFEFTFFKRFVKVIDGFYKDNRTPLKVVVDGGIEFRDSYALSNMKLEKFCENERGVIHYKLSGDDYDYSKLRTPSYIMTEEEEAYCYNDVRGLVECIRSRMMDDTLASMPMTSTGYVRRDARTAVQKNPKNRDLFTSAKFSPEMYQHFRDAFRGGNTHANLRMADQHVHEVDSYDIQSSYPACMMINRFPTSAFFRIKISTYKNYDTSDYALLFHVAFKNIYYIGDSGIPYIPLSKCIHYTKNTYEGRGKNRKLIERNIVVENGRILFCKLIEMWITDIDLDIIMSTYEIEDLKIESIYASRYAPLAKEYKDVIMKYFTGKTALRGIVGQEYEYTKSKNRLNSLYGLFAQRIDHDTVEYDGHDFKEIPCDLNDCIEKYFKSRNNFLLYFKACWVTSWARKRLEEMIQIVGRDVVYCDTDSIKCINGHQEDFEKINKILIEEAKEAGAFAKDKDGNIQYMGVWEHETSDNKGGAYDDFVTLGSKKYAYTQDGHTTSTIAGVNKKTGSEFFDEHGLDAFKNGTVIRDSGHLTAFYNDDEIHEIEINGEKIITASNVALVDNTYTLGVTNEYIDLLQKALDNQDMLYYI